MRRAVELGAASLALLAAVYEFVAIVDGTALGPGGEEGLDTITNLLGQHVPEIAVWAALGAIVAWGARHFSLTFRRFRG